MAVSRSAAPGFSSGANGLWARFMVRTMWRKAVKGAALLLLALAFVTPAMAEVACLEDSVSHLQADGSAAAEISAGGEQESNGSREKAGHCAFSHGAHCAAVQPASATAKAWEASASSFAGVPARPLIPSSRDGPERPPRA